MRNITVTRTPVSTGRRERHARVYHHFGKNHRRVIPVKTGIREHQDVTRNYNIRQPTVPPARNGTSASW